MLKRVVLSVTVVVLMLTSFWFGGYMASNQSADAVNRVQANLTFRHLAAYEKLYSYLESDCVNQAVARLVFLMDQQKMLLAEYVQDFKDDEFESYISSRMPGLIEELRQYDVDFGKELTLPGCKNR